MIWSAYVCACITTVMIEDDEDPADALILELSVTSFSWSFCYSAGLINCLCSFNKTSIFYFISIPSFTTTFTFLIIGLAASFSPLLVIWD